MNTPINSTQRITPPNITTLGEGEIFVFGSNTSGRHGKGAAKTAMKWGAKYGQGLGLMGRTYGIPTVNHNITAALDIPRIASYVDTFVLCAQANPSLTFLVTEIGCGLAGHKVKDIAPLFANAAKCPNVHLPERFWRFLS